MSMVHVIAVLTAKPGQRAAVLAVFNDIVPTVRAEEGCIAYEATIDTQDGSPTQAEFGEDTFVVVEQWSSLGALHAHSASAHMAALTERTNEMMAKREVYVLSPMVVSERA